MTTIYAEHLFDGFEWRRGVYVSGEARIEYVGPGPLDADISTDLLIPGLCDTGVRLQGYSKGPENRRTAFAAEEAFLGLCHRWGVTTVVDSGGSLAIHRAKRGRVAPRVASTLGRLTDHPTSRADLLTGPEEIAHTASQFRDLGAAVTLLAFRHGPVDPDIDKPYIVARQGEDEPLPGFVLLGVEGRWWAPQVNWASQWTVENMLDGHEAAGGRAFQPHLVHYKGRGGVIQRSISRGILTDYFGERTSDQVSENVNLEAIGSAQTDLLASSASGWGPFVPGRSLWEEMERLESVVGFHAALRSATGNVATALPELNCGRLHDGLPFDAIAIRGPVGNLTDLQSGIERVIAGGHCTPLPDLQAVVANDLRDADRRNK